MEQDTVIVSCILQGDMRAFKNLVDQHKQLVLHMVGRVVDDPQDREDICQEVFLKVYKSLSKFNFQSRLSTWIATIAYHTAINHRKKNKLSGRTTAVSKLPERSDDVAAHPLDRQDIHQFIHKEIQKLPLPYKTVLTLFHLEEMNYAEIMEVTGMPEGTVKSYLFRARKLLKDKLQVLLIKEELL